MDLLKLVLVTFKKNILLAIILAVIAIVAGVIHYNLQAISYVSNFKTNNGFVDYPLFKSLTDFKQITADVYDLDEARLDSASNALLDFKVSFVEETSASISFTAVSKDKDADHKLMQKSVLDLINNNRFLNNTNEHELVILKKKLFFLDSKMNLLDSLTMNPTEFTNTSKIIRDSYDLYTEKLELEKKIKSTGKFDVIKPIIDIKVNQKPIPVFIVLYLVLAGFVFLLLCKKEKLAVD
ncbi:MAG: hypothetical protein ACI8ZM_002738 [Crocinitomix sp.]|jgi:hypothetical protein